LLRTSVPGSSFAALKAKLAAEGSWAGELRHMTKDGRGLIVESRLQLEAFDGGRLVLESTRDVTDRRAAEQRQRLLTRELTHRVGNTLSIVQAIARHTFRGDQPNEQQLGTFERRLVALASAHTLLIESDWRGADLAKLAHEQLDAIAGKTPDRLLVNGEPIALAPNLATPFGLVLHELATNAAKHGALSTPSGRIAVSWTVGLRGDQRSLRFKWMETGGPTVSKPTVSGFGSTLVDAAIPGAQVTREFRPEGLVCEIEVALTESET